MRMRDLDWTGQCRGRGEGHDGSDDSVGVHGFEGV